jgi:glycosyltransferase involved in cell wall biosynthesis
MLLIVPTCDGQDIGEAWVAHQWVRYLRERNDLTVLTYHKRGSPPASAQFPGLRVIEWAEPRGLGRAERFNSMLKPGYFPFYVRARRWIRAALADGERFDIAFQPVPVAMRYPSPVAGLGIPYIMGPVGGSLQSPHAFTDADRRAPWYLQLRRLDQLRMKRDPWLRRTYASASAVVGIAPYVKDFLAGTAVQRFEVMSETGLDDLPDPVDRRGRDGDVRLLFVGRLVPTKGARDAIRALAVAGELPAVLDIVGDGFDRATCESLVADLNLGDRVRFHGRVPRAQVEEFYRTADIFIFPSYREPGGNVVFEAMGNGLPVIVSDIGGPGNVVDDTCGFRLHPQTPEQYGRDIAAVLTQLVTSTELRHALGDGARRRVADTGLWSGRARHLEALSAEIVSRQS